MLLWIANLNVSEDLQSDLEGSVEKGVICAKGVYEKGEVKITPYMQEAYEMGKSIS